MLDSRVRASMYGRSAVIPNLPPAALCSRMALVQAFYGTLPPVSAALTAPPAEVREEKRVEGGESAANNGETPGDDRRKHTFLSPLSHRRPAHRQPKPGRGAHHPQPQGSCCSGAGRVGGAGCI